MKLLDSIAKFVRNRLSHYKQKKLQAPKALDTDVISIIYDDKQRGEMALIIKEEINKYKDFYKVFLSDYDGICIGNTKSDLKKPLVIDDTKRTFIIQRPSPYHPKSKEHKKFKREQEKETLRIRSIELFESAISQTLKRKLSFDNMRKYYGNNDIKSAYESNANERNFYKQLLNDNITSPTFLYSIKDWNGLKIFLKSNSDSEFIKIYIEQNLFDTLNWAIELCNDDFYKKNINIIFEALDQRGNTELIPLIDFFIKKIEENIIDCGESSITNLNLLADEYIEESYKRIRQVENIDKTELSYKKAFELILSILDYIDPYGDLMHFFYEKMMASRIVLFSEKKKIC